jgi:fructose-1-phosphate kinase PfkB-like protein
VTLAAPAILAGSLPAGAPRAAAEALAAAARQGDGGLLIAWKPW